MRLHDIYKNDIDRDINGVIKVAQDDEKSIKQELVEYVITRELRKHFVTFLNNYEQSIERPTDKIGVWISGFFGSGKSHFLKILSYLLSNKTVAGEPSISYFENKFDDPMMFAQLEHCVSIPTDTILFNIDSKSPINKDSTAILRVFAKVFYEHLGLYGNDLKVAKLEQFISKRGKMDEFKEEFEMINGDRWENVRDAFAFWEDDIVAVLKKVLGMSENAATNWFNGTETAELTIEQLVSEISDYINSKGDNYRLLFMVDEVGQYIGSDGNLMLNLQTIVEEIGSKCGGRVWVMVTSQEAIDSITKISGDDFSKIQGRFNTRLSLSSSSVDEVIKKRILEKNDNAKNLLSLKYEEKDSTLRNLFTFTNVVLDIKGYEGEIDFIETYPFVPYQFRLIQNVLAQIRQHGNSGKHLSGGERSMLSGFQEAAQAIEDKDENTLVPFYLFYNTVHTFLESTIRRVIDRCQTAAENHDGIDYYDVEILKLLYLLRYVNDIKTNVDNISILMVDKIDADKIQMRKSIQKSLDRLVSQNYIARNGDTYNFLTDEEQDITKDINKIIINGADFTQKVGEIVYGELYTNKKYRYGKSDFLYDRFVDDMAFGNSTGGMKIRIATSRDDGEEALLMKSTNNEAIVVLSNQYPYFDNIENALKIRKYTKSKNMAQLAPSVRNIINSRQQEAVALEKQSKEWLSKAIIDADVYINGERVSIRGTTVKDKIDRILEYLVESVYFKLPLLQNKCDSEEELGEIFKTASDSTQVTLGGDFSETSEDIADIVQYLDMQGVKHLPTCVSDVHRRFSGIPYGWHPLDISAIIAKLLVNKSINMQYNGTNIQSNNPNIIKYICSKAFTDKILVTKRHETDKDLIEKTRKFLREYFNTMDIPSDEDKLATFVISKFTEQKNKNLQSLLEQYNAYNYPDKDIIEGGISLIDDLLSHQKDNTALFTAVVKLQDDLLDFNDDVADVRDFFNNQKDIFDKARNLISKLSDEKAYLETNIEIVNAIRQIQAIIQMKKPYRRISELPTYMQEIKQSYGKLLEAKREEIQNDITEAMGEIHRMADIKQRNIIEQSDNKFGTIEKTATETESLLKLNAMKLEIQKAKERYIKMLLVQTNPHVKSTTVNKSTLCDISRLESYEDIDNYVENIRNKLRELLNENDILQII